jgi:hypothetical protein
MGENVATETALTWDASPIGGEDPVDRARVRRSAAAEGRFGAGVSFVATDAAVAIRAATWRMARKRPPIDGYMPTAIVRAISASS